MDIWYKKINTWIEKPFPKGTDKVLHVVAGSR